MAEQTKKQQYILISLGGSLLVPNDIATAFIIGFKKLLVGQIEAGRKFIIVTGGGWTARHYIEAAHAVDALEDEDKDWLGIHATRLNAHLLRTVFRKYAHPRINTNPHDLEDFYASKEPVLVASGWRPGFSTDYDSVILAKYLDVTTILNLSNIDYVYDKDPRKYEDARRFNRMTWEEFRALVGDTWSPGLNSPFDPVASKLAQEEGLEVIVMNGTNLENLEQYFKGEAFQGTTIKD